MRMIHPLFLASAALLAALPAWGQSLPPVATPGALVSDDPANTQGFGTQALSGGVLNIEKITGLVLGSGLTPAQDTANGVLLAKAWLYASTTYTPLVCPDAAILEFNLAGGLVVKAGANNGVQLTGHPSCQLTQMAVNSPILVVGDPTGNTATANVRIFGFALTYGASQAGQTSAVALLEGENYFCLFDGIQVATSGYPPYDGWTGGNRPTSASPAVTGAFSFSNYYRNMSVGTAQMSEYRQHLGGTHNVIENPYFRAGGNPATAATMGDNFVWVGPNGYQSRSGDVWIAPNFEHWRGAGSGVYFRGVRNMTMIGAHFEDVPLNGQLVSSENSQVKMVNTDILDPFGSTTGNSLFKANYGGAFDLDGLVLSFSNASEFTGSANLLAGLAGTEGADSDVKYFLKNFQTVDGGGNNLSKFTFEPQMPTTLDIMAKVGSYTYDKYFSHTDGGEFNVSSNFTLYGQHENAVMIVPASLSAAITITLADLYHSGGTRPPNTNWLARLDRSGGTYANTATVVDAATPGTALATSSAAGTKQAFRFTGTANVTTN